MSRTFVFVAFFCLAAAVNVVRAVDCPPEACSAVDRTDPNTLNTMLPDPDLCDCTCDSSGNTLLHRSVTSKCGLCINMLVGSGCNVDVRDGAGNTPLHDAAQQCLNVPTSDLLRNGANPEARNNADSTPLCEVGAEINSSECGTVARNLISNGACPCRRCNGELPYDIAEARGLLGVRDVIGQDGGSPAQCAIDGCPF